MKLPAGIWKSRSRAGGEVYVRYEFKDPRTGRRVKRSDPKAASAEFRKAWRLVLGRGVELVGRAAIEYADWQKAACELDRDLNEIVRAGVAALRAEAGRSALPRVPLAQAIADFLKARAEKGCGAEHLTDLKQRLDAFAGQFPVTTADLSPALVAEFLRNPSPSPPSGERAGVRGRPISPRTRRNYRRVLENFINWARGEGLVDFDLSAVPVPIVPRKPIPIFHPDEMRWLLACAPPSVLPVLLLGGFAGLRTSEIRRLRWSDIHFGGARPRIRVSHEGKTGARHAPLLPNLRAWLEPLKRDGPVLTIGESSIDQAYKRAVARGNRELERRGEKLRLQWRYNALRHSFVSYRVAQKKELGSVAFECGHSVKMLQTHYLNLVDEEEATAWFAIRPGREQNIHQLSLFCDDSATPQTLPKAATP